MGGEREREGVKGEGGKASRRGGGRPEGGDGGTGPPRRRPVSGGGWGVPRRRVPNKARGVAQSGTARGFPEKVENGGGRSRREVAVAKRDSWSDRGVRSGPPPSSPCKAAAKREPQRLEAKESHAFPRGPPVPVPAVGQSQLP